MDDTWYIAHNVLDNFGDFFPILTALKYTRCSGQFFFFFFNVLKKERANSGNNALPCQKTMTPTDCLLNERTSVTVL